MQAERSRASERWLTVMAHLEAEWPTKWVIGNERGGNFFIEWRMSGRPSPEWSGMTPPLALILWQERTLFNSHIEARLTRAVPEQVDAARAIFAAVGVVVVVP